MSVDCLALSSSLRAHISVVKLNLSLRSVIQCGYLLKFILGCEYFELNCMELLLRC